MKKTVLHITSFLFLLFLFLPSSWEGLGVSVFAQQTLDDVDGAPWADAVSPIEGYAPSMVSIPASQVKHTPCDRKLSLSGEWTLYDGQGISVSAQVPCGIHSALMKAGAIPDPRLGRNDTIAEQCSYRGWTLERTFQYDGSMTDPLLSFKGVANKCRVWLNGQMIGEHEGMFGGPDIAVGSLLHKGDNTIKVELDRIGILLGLRESRDLDGEHIGHVGHALVKLHRRAPDRPSPGVFLRNSG